MTFPPPGPPPGQHPMGGWPPSKRVRPPISVGFAFLGAFVYFFLNFVLGFIGLMSSGSTSSDSVNTGFAVIAVALILIAFGGGGAMVASFNSSARGFGLGLMIGWALTSLFTVGICTGLNPSVYSL